MGIPKIPRIPIGELSQENNSQESHETNSQESHETNSQESHETNSQKLKEWKNKFGDWIESRFAVATAHIENEVRSMFEEAWMTKGGRWDLEGLKLEMAGKLGGENMES